VRDGGGRGAERGRGWKVWVLVVVVAVVVLLPWTDVFTSV